MNCEEIANRLLADSKPFERSNHSSWLESDRLREIHDGTEGPYGSPDPVECFMLHSLALRCPGEIVEFGSWRGRSACFLAESGKLVQCVDSFNGDNTGGANPDRASMEAALRKFGLRERVTIHAIDMLEMDVSLLGYPSLVFYDADHGTEPTTTMLRRLHPILHPLAVIAVHDADFETTKDALRDISDIYDSTIIPVWQGMAILTKQ